MPTPGKGKSIWDVYSHGYRNKTKPEDPDVCWVDDCHTGDVACDSYKNMERDIDQMVKMGVSVSFLIFSRPSRYRVSRHPFVVIIFINRPRINVYLVDIRYPLTS